jgi:hypothetical protein
VRVGGDTDPLNDCTRSFNFARRSASILRKPADSSRPRAEIDEWLAPYRRLWGNRLDALERHLDEREDR